MDDATGNHGDLDTPAPRSDGRSDWDDYPRHRGNYLDRDRLEEIEALWCLPAVDPPGETT